MTLITENGWPQCNSSQLDRSPVPGTGLVIPVKAGDPATILHGWAAWYDRNVEDIEHNYRPLDDWGWSATNDVWNSNHLSGTAIDLNATKYPWGLRRMPADKIAAVEHGLRLFEGTVFWGAWWRKPDEMHYQLGLPQGHRKIAEFAQKLRNGHLGIYGPPPQNPPPAPGPKPREHTVRPGETLSRIAGLYGLTWQQLHAMNKDRVRNPAVISVGQILRLEPERSPSGGLARTHTVRPGETLASIASTYGTTWQRLYELNRDRINNPNIISVGAVLRLMPGA
ncbi:LysM peptidoglycan-binding domain-containing protein [Rhodococcus sp. 11-3]|uniref:LysM peptidoglycan-binding domain-containing protein n=1 Tax=Rhodococcus sp. 11-3 TaxID=2854796 RepID=UPI00203E4464|nr:LysM peptidoglycan-binding domain-containing protein [Rhodococcus sp. 11-3]USC17048.1 LysM peptidoglycan-binding domain-containing protein [Rhodococcus sp. 11-3]